MGDGDKASHSEYHAIIFINGLCLQQDQNVLWDNAILVDRRQWLYVVNMSGHRILTCIVPLSGLILSWYPRNYGLDALAKLTTLLVHDALNGGELVYCVFVQNSHECHV